MNKKPSQNQNVPVLNQFEALNNYSSGSNQDTSVSREVAGLGGEMILKAADKIVGTLPTILRSILAQPISVDMDVSKKEEQAEEANYWKKKWRMAEMQRSEEKQYQLMKRQEQENRVLQVRETLQSLTYEIASYAHEIDVAVFEAPVEADVYDENFFEQLLSTIMKIKKKINLSKQWLATQNARAAKKANKNPFMKQNNRMQVDAYKSGERRASFGG